METQTVQKNGIKALLSKGFFECHSKICNGRKTQTIVRLDNGRKICICMHCAKTKDEPSGEMIRY